MILFKRVPSPPAPLPRWGEGSQRFIIMERTALIERRYRVEPVRGTAVPLRMLDERAAERPFHRELTSPIYSRRKASIGSNAAAFFAG